MQYEPEANRNERSFNLTVIEEKREVAYTRILHHKGLMMKSHDRKSRPRQLQVGDLVLKKVEASKHVGKLEEPREGPYKAARHVGSRLAAPMEYTEPEEVLRVNREKRSNYGACERPSTWKRLNYGACVRPSTWERSNYEACERPSTWKRLNYGACERPSTWKRSNYGARERPSTWKRLNYGACERPSTWRRSNSGACERPPIV
ncbi:UNVERIFIED_CONTAM: hypothetical protein Sindi_2878600 [Sesamum indicum]